MSAVYIKVRRITAAPFRHPLTRQIIPTFWSEQLWHSELVRMIDDGALEQEIRTETVEPVHATLTMPAAPAVKAVPPSSPEAKT